MHKKVKNEFINYAEPQWLKPQFENIPEELKEQPWAVWRAEPREGQLGKFNKAPRNPNTGIKIGANQPDKFRSFEEAKKAYEDGGFTGVGVLLTANGIIGIDIDNLENGIQIDPGLKDWIQQARKLGAYGELSPSGTGLRFFVKGNLDKGGYRVRNLEVYADKRFLTVTGNTITSKQGA